MTKSQDPEFKKGLARENARLYLIQRIVDAACMGLSLGILTRRGALELMADTRRRVLELAPDDEDKYDLIYAPRLRRMAKQFAGLDIEPGEERGW